MAEQKKTDTARYDRQLRLWGEEGQSLLEDAKICLINATATGTETLKNLILPGIGSFTIVDPLKVEEADLGNNFFVTAESLGKSRASVTCELLQELNTLTRGDAVEKDGIELIEKDPSFYTKFTHIIANDVPETPLLKLAKMCSDNHISLLVERSFGFIGYLRLFTNEHTVVESKPDNPADDLRIADPFPELAGYAASLDLEKMDSTNHSHTPYIIILLKYLQQWKNDHDGKVPDGRPEREAFKSLVIRGSRNSQEENFAEAYRSAHKAFQKPTIPSSTRTILDDPQTSNITKETPKFWVLAAALKGFVENEGNGKLPLMGSIPDMTASTNFYITLQKLYQDKALADATAVANRTKDLLVKAGRSESEIPFDDVKKFCKNSQFLQAFRYRSLEQERNPSTAKVSVFNSELGNPGSNFNFYVALRAADRFYTKNKRNPGSADEHVAQDKVVLQELVEEILNELGVQAKVEEKYSQELVRYGACELHTIASVVGGVASQELIKIITHQFSPMDNTLIFNGIDSTSGSYNL